MAHVITQNCCNDSACVDVCPVDCIHPGPDEEGFAAAEMLFIDPEVCIDCGACAAACPVDAIYPEPRLPDKMSRYPEMNAAYAKGMRIASSPLREPIWTAPRLKGKGRLRVAIVGSGPSGAYAATHLLRDSHALVEVTMLDRLPTPWGLVRAGVSPDHPQTKAVVGAFERIAIRPEFNGFFNISVGEHISPDELLRHHHAVIYATGASNDRALNIPGEHLPGSHPVMDFVHWYNGHPDACDLSFDLSGKRAIVVGNGNVALDVARMLVMNPDELARTDIADHALAALRQSNVEEVVVLGRRGPAQAAFTSPELLALSDLDDVDVIVDPDEVALDQLTSKSLASAPVSAHLKTQILTEIAERASSGNRKRIVLRFLTSPTEILGSNRVEGVRIARNQLRLAADGTLRAEMIGSTEVVQAQLVLRATGFRGSAVATIPFDEATGTFPNNDGRVIDAGTGAPLQGIYTTGWIKRGPSGVIGTNRKCSMETVRSLEEDFAAGLLADPVSDGNDFAELVNKRQPEVVEYRGWQAIDLFERRLGAQQGRPRIKITSMSDMLDVAQVGGIE